MTDDAHSLGDGKRLLWFSVNCSYSHSSLALPLLHSACANLTQWEWFRLETTIEDDPQEVAARLAGMDCDLLCSTLYLFNRGVVLDILERFHALRPDCSIAVGGPECLGSGADALLAGYPFLHTVFRGEGEGVFPEFLTRFSSSAPRSVIPPDGTAVYDEWAKTSSPARDPFFRTDKPFVQMETSRGCPMGCVYCTSCRTPVRFKSMESVASELEILRDSGVREIRLLDRTFNLPQDRGVKLLRLFRTEFPELRFHLEIHPQFLNEELRAELLSANPGQLHIEAGIQCLAENVQNAIGRRSPPADALSGLRFLSSCRKFETHADLLAGLPEQTIDTLFDDVSSLIQAGPAEIQLEVLKVLPGTPLRSSARTLGLVFAPSPPYDVMRTPLMPTADILLARKLSRLLDLTFNHSALHSVIRAAHAEQPGMLRPLLDFFLSNGLDFHRLFDLKSRFQLLSSFFALSLFPAAERELSFQWLSSGYPSGTGPGEAAEKADCVPSAAVLLSGDPGVAELRETKFWRLSFPDSVVYFAFNRAYAPNRPAAVWRSVLFRRELK